MSTGLKREDQIDESQKDKYNTHPNLDRTENEVGQRASDDQVIAGMEDGLKQGTDDTKENQDSVAAQEQQGGWNTNVPTKATESSGSERKSRWSRVKSKAKKNGPLIGIGGGLAGILIGVATSFLGLVSFPISAVSNLVSRGDTSSVAMERRFMKVFGKATQPNPLCKSSKKSMKCRMGRISNKALRKLEKKGIRTNLSPAKRFGYARENPTRYFIDVGDGKPPKSINAKDFKGFLLQPENRSLASKVLGRSGAFNMRYKAWVGKHITNKLFKPFHLKRNGGVADGKNESANTKKLYQRVLEKLKLRTPASGEISTVADRVGGKLTKRLGKAKKGGSIYLAAVAGCLIPKVPRIIAAGVAAVQLAQVMSVVTDTVLSPGSKAKASGVENTFSPGDAEAVGSLLTTQTPREGDGKMTSALDSPYLQSAMGINQNKPPVSKEYTPGYSILKNKVVQASALVDDKAAPVCDKILSPQAMYAAAAVDAIVTGYLSLTVFGGIIKVAAAWSISAIVIKAVAKIAKSKKITSALLKLAKNNKIPKATGQALGDVLGIGAAGFFSAGGMAHLLPTLMQSQVAAYDQIRQKNESFNRDMDIATLGPFDTSSKYTFLGSIVNNAQLAMISNGAYTGNFSSIVSSIFSLPSLALTPTASATTGLTSKYCGYAEDFGFKSNDAEPAINMAGLPCTGITPEQDAMSTDRAIDLITTEGWFDENATINDDSTIGDLVHSGYIKKNTPLFDYIKACGDASNGDYLFNAGSCTVDSAPTEKDSGSQKLPETCFDTKNDDGTTTKDCASNSKDFSSGKEVTGLEDSESVQAMAVFLIDYQVHQSMNGEDDEETQNSSATEGSQDFTVATYNMCQELSHPGCPKKSTKTDLIANNILGEGDVSHNPFDIVGAEELSRPTQQGVLNNLSDYSSFPSEVPKSRGVAVFWNSSKFTKTADGYVTGIYDNAGDPSKHPWVKLKSTTGQTIYALSTHSPNSEKGNGNLSQRLNNARKYLAWAKSKATGSDLVVITGDFNSYADHGQNTAYCILTKDTLQLAQDLQDNKGGACPTKKITIDQIYTSRNVPGLTADGYNRINDSSKSGTDHGPSYVNYHLPSTDNGSIDSEGWTWPVPGVKSLGTLGYGGRGSKGIHKGIDIGISGGAALGRTVVAAHSGTVNRVWGNGDACGSYVSIQASGTNYYAAYQHVADNSILVKAGDVVNKGQPIAKIGRQGGSTCGSSGFYHLHFSIETKPGAVSAYADPFPNGTINPLKLLSK